MKFELWHAFVLGTVLAWGVYVPVLHEGQKELGEGNPGAGSVRAFFCLGLAYFLTAVIIPVGLLALNLAGGERFAFVRGNAINWGGIMFATLGGVVGAAGALGIILALKVGGKPLFIVPLVFAGAPIVSTLASLLWHPPQLLPGPLFYIGIVLAASGAGFVLYAKGDLDRRSREAANRATASVAAPFEGAVVSVPSKP